MTLFRSRRAVKTGLQYWLVVEEEAEAEFPGVPVAPASISLTTMPTVTATMSAAATASVAAGMGTVELVVKGGMAQRCPHP